MKQNDKPALVGIVPRKDLWPLIRRKREDMIRQLKNGPNKLAEMLESLPAALKGAAPRFREILGPDGRVP